MFNRILLVCAGNICRSPTAEYIFKHYLANKGIQISSAGLTALENHSADEKAQQIALQNKINMEAHQGQQINEYHIIENDVILVMEKKHMNDLFSRFPEARGKTFLLGKWLDDTEIPDPYRQTEDKFSFVYKLIDDSCRAWLKYF